MWIFRGFLNNQKLLDKDNQIEFRVFEGPKQDNKRQFSKPFFGGLKEDKKHESF